jgi:fermentation-respiration switch protein FrsA (DUF1100 family)
MFEGMVRSFLYYPLQNEREAPVPPYCGNPDEVWIKSGDGNEIHGLHWKAPEGRPTMLFFHGNAQSVFEWCLIYEELAPAGCGLLLIDYPGYGKSTGQPNEEGLYAAGRASLEWLKTEGGVPEERIVLFGKSLGGPVAAETAMHCKPRGVILESTFRSIPHVARKLLPMLPVDAVLKSERYETAERVPGIEAPVLVIHGTRDELIPFEEGQALFELALEPKQHYWVDNAGHNDVSMVAESAYGERIREWLEGIG